MTRGNDSRVIRHEQCPLCQKEGKDRRQNNLAVYDDGHKFCFAGHGLLRSFSSTSPLLSYLQKRIYQYKEHDQADGLANLGELTHALPDRVIQWLNKYGITEKERYQNDFQWSEEKQYLILPIFNEQGYCIGTNSRYFGDNPKHPKYVSQINRQGIWNIKTPNEIIIPALAIVEDIVSSIKVARHAPSLALLGTHIPDDLLLRIVSYCTQHRLSCIIWLDPDKRDTAARWAKRMSQFVPAAPLWSDKDPKEHTDVEIVELLSCAVKVFHQRQEELGAIPAHPGQ